MDQKTISRAACDAAVLLTEAIRELTIPQHLVTCAKRLEDAHQVSDTYAAAVRRIAMAATVIGIYRVGETRKHFLTPWLFSEEELQHLGLPDIEHFVRDFGAFETIRSQWAAHAQAKRSTARGPGRLIDASALSEGTLREKFKKWSNLTSRRRDRARGLGGLEAEKRRTGETETRRNGDGGAEDP